MEIWNKIIDFKYYCHNFIKGKVITEILDLDKLIMNIFQFSNMIHHKTKYPKDICEMITNYIFNTKAIEDVLFKICKPSKAGYSDGIKIKDVVMKLQSKYKNFYFVEYQNINDRYKGAKLRVFRSVDEICELIFKTIGWHHASYSIRNTKYGFEIERKNNGITLFWCRIIYKNNFEYELFMDRLTTELK